MESVNIEFHADDYGLFPAQSQEIIDCYQNGQLDAVSVIPNSPYLRECMEMLRPYQEKIKMAVHLNFIEGYSICNPSEVPLLTDEKGRFNISFGKFLLAYLLPGRKRYVYQICQEIRAQIYAVMPYLKSGDSLRIDGHAHYHMLPVVFDSLIQVLEEEKLSVAYIRIPSEKLSIYLRAWWALEGIKPVNFIKVMILNLLAVRNKKKHKKYLEHMEDKLFLGVALSGNMSQKNVSAVLPNAVHKAAKKRHGIEVLAHPGGVYVSADISQLTHPGDIKFLTSDLRKMEKKMLYTIRN